MQDDSNQIRREIHANVGRVEDTRNGTGTADEAQLANAEIKRLSKLLEYRLDTAGKEIQ